MMHHYMSTTPLLLFNEHLRPQVAFFFTFQHQPRYEKFSIFTVANDMYWVIPANVWTESILVIQCG